MLTIFYDEGSHEITVMSEVTGKVKITGQDIQRQEARACPDDKRSLCPQGPVRHAEEHTAAVRIGHRPCALKSNCGRNKTETVTLRFPAGSLYCTVLSLPEIPVSQFRFQLFGKPVANTGEFRVANKFYVLCASGYREETWGDEPDTDKG